MPELEHVSVASLRDAATRGVISPTQLEALLVGADALARHSPTSTDPLVGNEGDEQLRFVRSFGDIFIAIGVALALGALGIAAGTFNLALGSGLTIVFGAALAEWLVGKKRLALPGIVLALGMTAAGVVFLPALLGYGGEGFKNAFPAYLAGGGAAAVASAFYWRHRLPYALSLIGAAIIGTVFWLLKSDMNNFGVLVLASGLSVFAVAMWFDRQDRARAGRLSDCGFWLHILAAPLITHGFVLMLGLAKSTHGNPSDIGPSLALVAFFGVMCAVALFIDRRALLVSAFAYVIGAVIQLVNMASGSGAQASLIVAGLFGLFVIGLGVYWHSLRAKLFASLAHSAPAQWVPEFRARAQA
jgi:hypothetical protein